ncbi:hypothetical protein [Amycolatopsis sp. DG1A-15b]|uniref:hypothetical protein n=1 Tax=Amycolatopsis sp. DG1A-15b TaxID=3052846 RepID=UPI00255C23E9|nr:hypothetical protein [Amycolatopsis sp. DG1A-15b]WIX85692.1 hypothetical protein QRY02_31330 [Amycolatopsis sp. DG1A-15b]
MGVVLEPTPEMGTWSVEVFLDSACFRSWAVADCVDRSGAAASAEAAAVPDAALPVLDPQRPPGGFAIPAADVVPVVAAVDQVPGEPLYFDYIQHGDLDLGCWREPVVEHGWLHVPGPVVDAGVYVSFRWIEVSYSHLAELRYHLADFLERTCPEEHH